MTPPINSEISKKLRAAIRAKLEELGVYVDDELPDYIMVMIANKKEKKQMKDDLTLFLSKNTDAFVEWLFDICHRLQSAPVAAPAAETKPSVAKEAKKEKTAVKKKIVEGFSVKKENKPEKAKKKTASDAEKEKERERERQEKKEAERREIERANREDRERREREQREKKDREERREKEKEREERDREKRERERKEREQRDRERDEERQKEREREKRREREREKEERDTPPIKRRHSPIRTRRALSPEAPAPSAAVRRRVERSPERRKEVPSTITRAVSPPPVTVQSKVVVKRQVRSQNDKAGAKGASSMFLRAMNAASVSAGYGGGPVSRKRAAPSANADVPQFSDEEEFANGDVEEEEDEKEVEVVPRKKAVPAGRRVVQPPAEKKEPRFIVTFNKKEGEEDGKRRAVKRGAREKDEEDEGAVRVSSAPRKTITVSGEKRRREGTPREEGEEEESRKRMSISVSPPQKHSSPSDWDGHINLNDDETSDEEAAIDAMLAATRASRVSSRGGDTERLPPTSQLSRGNSYYEQPYDPSQPAVSAVHVAPQAYVPTPLPHPMARSANPNKIQERCKFFPNCKEGDACIYLHPATRHCTNFPRCSFGARCLFTHPKCKFDSACSNAACPFTHTVQKASPFDKAVAVVAPRQTVVAPVAAVNPAAAPVETAAVEEKKTKIEPDVPLVPAPQPAARTRVPSTLMVTINCRFAAGCTNPTCAYKHPTACRFGQNCRNYNCYFYHPPAGRVPTAAPAAPAAAFASPSKLKWTAAAAPKTETV